ncbi:MAG: drug/metabolite exporter YedA [Ginsengibacter sp.]
MNKEKRNGLVALGAVCIIWGTTYYALRIGVKSFPPLLFSGIRQMIGGFLLLIIMLLIKQKFNWKIDNLLRQALIGFLMMVMGNGLVGWAEVFIPSGLAALIASLIPLNIVLINYISGKERKINAQIIAGLFLGLCGMGFIFKDNLKDLGNSGYFTGLMMSLTASVCWSLGTVLVKKYNNKSDTPYHNMALQMLVGGIVMGIGGFFIEDHERMFTATSESWEALFYLVIFGSIVALLSYQYAIKTLSINTVSLYAYINPFIAIILGCVLLNEKFTWYTAIAFVLTLSGIYMVNNGNNSFKRSNNG